MRLALRPRRSRDLAERRRRPRGSRRRPGRGRRRPTRPRRSRRARRAARAGSRGRAAAAARSPRERPGAQAPAAARAPRGASPGGRRRARTAGSARALPARPARPRGEAPRARRAAAGAGRRGRTTRARCRRDAARRGRAAPRARAPRRTPATSRPKRSLASAVVNGPRPLREAEHELPERVGAALEEHLGQPARRHRAERVAVAAGVLGRDQPLLARDAKHEGTALGEQRPGKRRVVLPDPAVAADAQLVVELVGRSGLAAKLPLDLVDRVGVEQVAQLLAAEQLAEQVAVERERLRAPLGRRRVVLVHVRRDVVEEERRAHRRGASGLDLDEVEPSRLDPGEQRPQRRQVEDVLEALAVGLEHDRERAVAARDLQQRLRLEPLLPERRALAGPAARDQERAGGVLAEAGAEERRLAELGDDEILDLGRLEQQIGDRRRRVGVGEVDRDPVVRPDRLRVEPERLAQPAGDRHRPGRVHAAAERREDADAPVADLVAEALDDDRAVGRARRRSRRPGRAGRRAGCGRRARRAGSRPQPFERRMRRRAPRARARRRRSSRRARTAARRPRPSRTAPPRERPGAGETSTRSRVISSIRQVDAPSRNVWPARAS